MELDGCLTALTTGMRISAKTFGEAQRMKTYKTENARQVGLDELVADNEVVRKA
ncbi:MAG: hypothetical protein ABIR70_08350 [Bryobacteraceae bacterium]